MSDLYKLELEHIQHRGKTLYFEKNGKVYYGRSEEDLIFPEGMEIQGHFPPIFIADIANAFKLGMTVKVFSGKENVDLLLRWMIEYIVEESFSVKHLQALTWIVGLFNECEESEREIFEFAERLYDKYAR